MVAVDAAGNGCQDAAVAEPRFYVRESSGYPINERGGQSASVPLTTLYIMDRLYNCRVVETFVHPPHTQPKYQRGLRRAAKRRCAQLNRWWELELARG
jgi:hypothetical protein